MKHTMFCSRLALRTTCARVTLVALLQLSAAIAWGQGKESDTAPSTIAVKSVRVEGNTLLSEPRLLALVEPLRGQARTMAELNAAAARVQAEYRKAGYGGVVAFVPEQVPHDGVVVIRVVEGKIANVRVSGNKHFTNENVRRALPGLREGTTPVIRAIDRDIQVSNENPAKQVAVTLTSGAKAGDIDAEVAVEDMQPVQLLFGYSNTGNALTGRDRVSVGLRHANVTGRDDVVTVQYQTSPEQPGEVHVATLGYRLPLYALGGSLDALYAHSNVSSGTTLTPAGPLFFAGKGDMLSLRGNLNFERRRDIDSRAYIGADYKDFKNDCSLGAFGALGCGAAGVSVKVLPIVAGYTAQAQSPTMSWGASASVAVNVAGSNESTFEAARPGAKRHYRIGRFSGFVDSALAASGLSVSARLDGQISPDSLVVGERYGLGGLVSVRGYEERELNGDSGYALRLELLLKNFELGPSASSHLRPLMFLDSGRVSSHGGLPCRGLTESSCTLASAGVGARLAIAKSVSATLDFAHALRDGVVTRKGDNRTHVSVTVAY